MELKHPHGIALFHSNMLPSLSDHASPRSSFKASSCLSLQVIMIPLLWFYLFLVPLCLLYLIHMATTVSNNPFLGGGGEFGSSFSPSHDHATTTTIHTTVHVRSASFSSHSLATTIPNDQRFIASIDSSVLNENDTINFLVDDNKSGTAADTTSSAADTTSSATASPSAFASLQEDFGSLVQSEEVNATQQVPNLLAFSAEHCPASYPSTSNTTYQPWKPMWIAGYPGSGNDLLRKLVEHLSGFPGKDVYTDDHCHLDPDHEKYDAAPKRRTSLQQSLRQPRQQRAAATCKTHYPAYKRYPPHEYTHKMTQDAAILLVRNPMNAMPSHFNFLWEYQHRIPDHSQQAPEQAWITWRNSHWQEQLQLWQQLLYYWYEHWQMLIVLPYEHMVQSTRGPLLLQMLAEQLDENHVPPKHAADNTTWLDFDTYDFGCHWHYCVQSKRGATVKRSSHAYQPTFTPEQYEGLRQVLGETYQYFKVRGEKDMAHLLWEYLTTVHTTSMQLKYVSVGMNATVESVNVTTATR